VVINRDPTEPPSITFCIPGRPVPAARMTVRGKFRKRQAQRYLEFKTIAGYHALMAMGSKPPMSGPIRIECTVWLSGGNRGDADNYLKAILDALNGIAWQDDKQVVDARITLNAGTDGVEVDIWQLG
jgi:crossover junction endodeoxyribonuclease RusA